jgi:hypothetical protein
MPRHANIALINQEYEGIPAMTMKDVRGAHNPKVVGSNPTPAIEKARG